VNDWPIIAIRWALYLDLGLLFGIPLFALYAFGSDRRGFRYLPVAAIIRWLALAGLVLTALGFALQTSAMAGVALTQLDEPTVNMVLKSSALGSSVILRAAVLLAILVATFVLSRRRHFGAAIMALGGAVCLATLPWSGHGAAGDATAGRIQLIGDIFHLLAAGAWLGAIVAFLIIVGGPRVPPDLTRLTLAHRALEGFSGTGTILVGVLILTGLLNSFFLVGPDHVISLGNSLYGLLLVAKLGLFAAMIAMAALNRYRLTPALNRVLAEGGEGGAVGKLQASLLIEGSFALFIMGLVAWLGTLAPPISA
jgi:putative copper resistance protein D